MSKNNRKKRAGTHKLKCQVCRKPMMRRQGSKTCSARCRKRAQYIRELLTQMCSCGQVINDHFWCPRCKRVFAGEHTTENRCRNVNPEILITVARMDRHVYA